MISLAGESSTARALPEEAISVLTLTDDQPGILLDDGKAAFTVTEEDHVVTLTPADQGSIWTVSYKALKQFGDCGYEQLNLVVNTVTVELPVEFEFCGRIYAGLRSEGYVFSDFELQLDGQTMRAMVDEISYIVNENGELIAE